MRDIAVYMNESQMFVRLLLHVQTFCVYMCFCKWTGIYIYIHVHVLHKTVHMHMYTHPFYYNLIRTYTHVHVHYVHMQKFNSCLTVLWLIKCCLASSAVIVVCASIALPRSYASHWNDRFVPPTPTSLSMWTQLICPYTLFWNFQYSWECACTCTCNIC